jgi:putative phage-type endonuclease
MDEQNIRKLGLSGTDAAAICGVSPWMSPADVWIAKKHPESARRELGAETAELLHWGTKLEPVVAAEYCEQTGAVVYKPEPTLMVNAKLPWLIGSPDYLVRGKNVGLEIKTALEWSKSEWGPSGTDIIPMHYFFQCMHYMMLTGYREWHVAVLIGAREFRVYQLFLHKEAAQLLLETEQEFLDKYIIGNSEPPMDFGANVKQWIKNRFPKSENKTIEVTAYDSQTIKTLLTNHAEIVEQFEKYKKEKEASVAKIQVFMQDAAYLNYPDGHIHIRWKNDKEGMDVDWQAITNALLARPELAQLPSEEKEAIFKANTHKRPPKRPFHFKEKE